MQNLPKQYEVTLTQDTVAMTENIRSIADKTTISLPHCASRIMNSRNHKVLTVQQHNTSSTTQFQAIAKEECRNVNAARLCARSNVMNECSYQPTRPPKPSVGTKTEIMLSFLPLTETFDVLLAVTTSQV